MGGGEQDGHDQLGHGELRWNALNEIVSWAFWTIFWTKVIPYTWIPYFFFFLDRFYKLGIQSVWIIIVVVIYYSLFEKIQLPDFLFKVELICSRFFFFFFSPQGIRPKHPPLREARAKVRGVRGEGRGKDRRDKRGQSPFGARHHVIHSASGPSGRGLLAHDGHPSGRFGSRPFSTRRRVSIGMAFLYLSSSIPFQILSGESLITTLDFVRHVSNQRAN